MSAFSDVTEVSHWKNRAAGIHELFGLPSDPTEAFKQIEKSQTEGLNSFIDRATHFFLPGIINKLTSKKTSDENQKTEEMMNAVTRKITSFCQTKSIKGLFDLEEKVAFPLYQKAVQTGLEAFRNISIKIFDEYADQPDSDISEAQLKKEIRLIAKEYAKLDGYDVMLRTIEVFKQDFKLKETKSWIAPVRVYSQDEEWESKDGKLIGSHANNGDVRPEYVSEIELYDNKGILKEELLDPDCIEARNWNLSAGQYKPFTFEAIKSDKSVIEMLSELKNKEQLIVEGLDNLLAIVRG
jgi:type I restriction enzyme M protein